METKLDHLSESLLEERRKNMELEGKLASMEKQYRVQLEEIELLKKEKERIRALNSAGEECSDVYSYFRRFIWSENTKNEAVTADGRLSESDAGPASGTVLDVQ